MSEALQRLYNEPRISPSVGSSIDDCLFSKTWPVCFEFLTVTRLGNKERATGTILLLSEGGQAKAWVNDRHAGLSAFVTSSSYERLLETIEKGLASGGLEWRKAKSNGYGGFKPRNS